MIRELHQKLVTRECTAVALVEQYFSVIEAKEQDISAYLTLLKESALAEAREVDEQIARGESIDLLSGIPGAIKDNILIEGIRATSASKILDNYIAPYDATVIAKLKALHVPFLGKTNMDEFALGSSTENSAYQVTKNPHDVTRVPGGTSGGSVAAVVSGMAVFALGSDTGGSIRQPASFCGVVGLKPTYGTISRHGLMAMGSSLDIIGPITNTVSDAEAVFKTLAHHDALDATSFPNNARVCEKTSVKKIGVPRGFLKGEGIDTETMANFETSLEKLKNLGYDVVDVEVPFMEYSLAVYYILMPAEVSTNLSRYDGIRYGLSVKGATTAESYKNTKTQGFGDETKRRLLLGAYVLSHGYYDAYYNKAIKVRAKITEELNKVFQTVDLLVTPTTPTPAFKPGDKKDPVSMYLSDIFTVPANIAGVPAISIPNGKTSSGLPLDIQFIAPHFGENLLFEVGKKYERA
jgi:aspartyl-tRNA(Asn)/glutamyl-tRNA(Gln) amidotransferase subunit A